MEPDAPTGQMVKAVLMDINVRGLQSPGVFARFLFEACKLVASDRVHAFTAQEHNLDPAREADLKRMCAQKHMTLTVAFAPAAADGTNWGGTLTLTSNAHFVHKNVKTCLPHITRVEVEWCGRLLELASVYLPQSPLARVNVLVGMDAHMSDSTLVGGDFNVVPDVTLDVQSSNPLNYSNQGAALLAQHMTSHGLVDERREQLGT